MSMSNLDSLPSRRCATCGSINIATPEVTHDGNMTILVSKKCEDCSTTWVDHYKFEKETDYIPGD